jgi:hypothetical protein
MTACPPKRKPYGPYLPSSAISQKWETGDARITGDVMLKKNHSAYAQSRARALLEAHLADPFITPAALATRFNISRKTVYEILARPESRAYIDKFNTEYSTLAAAAAAKRATSLLELADTRICAALTDPNCDPSFALSVRNALTGPLNSPTTSNTQYNFLVTSEDLAASRARIRAYAASPPPTNTNTNTIDAEPQQPTLPPPNNNNDNDALDL